MMTPLRDAPFLPVHGTKQAKLTAEQKHFASLSLSLSHTYSHTHTQAHRHPAAASTLASPAATTKPNTPLASTATMVAEPAVAAVEKTVLDKEADVFTSSESAVDKLEHEMLKKVARENAQRLAEEASTRKLEGLSPRAISPAHPALASASATSTHKRGAAAVVTKAHATKGLQIPRAALKTLQQVHICICSNICIHVYSCICICGLL